MNTSFVQSVQKRNSGIRLIAEIKLRSPSEGELGDASEMEKRIYAYEKGGADALSLVVEKSRFGGDVEMIRGAKKVTRLPILAKDFITSESQVDRIKEMGADAALLIVKFLPEIDLNKLITHIHALAIEPVVEIQNEDELEIALRVQTHMIAVNARNLSDKTVDIARACLLIRKIPKERITLGFSGVKTRQDVLLYENAGAHAVLVGTTLMKSLNPGRVIGMLKYS